MPSAFQLYIDLIIRRNCEPKSTILVLFTILNRPILGPYSIFILCLAASCALGLLQAKKEGLQKEKERKEKGWFGGWFGGGKSKEPEEPKDIGE